MPTPDGSPPPAPSDLPAPDAPKSRLPWLFLALWVAWIAFLAYMSRHEWGVPRIPAQELRDAPKEERPLP